MMGKTIQAKLEENFSRLKSKIAVEYGKARISYSELDQRTVIIREWLLGKGYPKGTFVGILCGNRVDFISSILGVLRAGCVFVPIDPSNPIARMKKMIDTVELKLLFIDSHYLWLADQYSIDRPEVEFVNVAALAINEKEKHLPLGTDLSLSPDDQIYIYFTSGTSGSPKAIIGKNKSLLHYCQCEIDMFNIGEGFRISQFATTSDAFLKEIYVAFLSGGTLCVPENLKNLLTFEKLVDWIESSQVTMVHCVPHVFRIFSSGSLRKDSFPDLKYVVLSGETIYPRDLKNWFEHLDERIKIVNLYGTTETTILNTYYFITKSDVSRERIPIGKPMKGNRIIILDEEMNICGKGIPGEIFIRTPYRTFGYFDDAPLNQKKFIPNPFNDDPDDLIYKTGDMGLFLPDGNIEFLGRMDRQIKIRGHRIELQEIESILKGLEGIKEVSVIKRSIFENNELLIAYYTRITSGNVFHEDDFNSYLRASLEVSLPDYMVPTYLIELENMPLKPNRKIDYQALPDPMIEDEKELIPPENTIQQKLVEIWTGILKADAIGIHDNFFELGGSSLNIMTLTFSIHKEFDVKLSLGDVFDNPTVALQAKIIESECKDQYLDLELAESKEFYRLSSAQKRLFILQELDLRNTGYNMTQAMILEGPLDSRKLEEVFNLLIKRHHGLRSSFFMLNNEPMQRVHKNVPFEISLFETDAESGRIIPENLVKPFHLAHPPLLRVALIKIDMAKHLLVVDIHHIIADATSIGILLKEFINLYGEGELLPLKVQYKDFSEWQNRSRQGGVIKEQENFWLSEFKGDIPVLDLPIDFVRPMIQSFEGKTLKFEAGRKVSSNLRKIAAKEGATLYMVLLAVFNVLLAQISSQDDIVVGTPTAGRRHKDLQTVIGMFVNTLALRNYFYEGERFNSFLKRLKNRTVRAFENQDYQFEDLVERLTVVRDTSRNPLFDVMFALHNIEVEDTGVPDVEIADLKLKKYYFEQPTSKFDLSVDGVETSDGRLLFGFEYCTKLFKDSTIKRLTGHFGKIISVIIDDPTVVISEIEIMTEDERKQILFDFNNTYKDIIRNESYHQVFENRVSGSPDKIAAVYGDQQVTYRKLNDDANRIAHFMSERAVGANVIVALYLHRSIKMLVAILGIFKAGGAYLPLEIEYPQERIKKILLYSEVEHLICDAPTLNVFNEIRGSLPRLSNILCLGQGWPDVLAKYSNDNLSNHVYPEDLSFVIYTSGTTGKPKGVMNHHLGMLNHMYANLNFLDVDERDILAQTASVCFDISVWQFLACLLRGGGTYIIDKEIVLDPEQFLRILQKGHITILEHVPSWIASFLEIIGLEENIELKSLRWMITCGEAISASLVHKWYEMFPKVRLVNAYGPAEASDDISLCILDDEAPDDSRKPIAIGKPVQNLHIYILDRNQLLCPVGVKGEICVAGIGVGNGYLNDKERTSRGFVKNPFSKTFGNPNYEILYKSGDIGRYREDGILEFFGRLDHQVKLRGNRIEIGEIESLLSKIDKIKEVVVLDREGNDGDKYLCAYFVRNQHRQKDSTCTQEELSVTVLREYLSRQLPEYMIPSYFVQLEEFPLTPNGKINRKALPVPEVKATGEYSPPRDKVEKTLTRIWSGILGLDEEKISIEANFFELGGHSLKATAVVSGIHKELNIKIPLIEIFKSPTIRGLSEYLRSSVEEKYMSIKQVEKKEYYRLSSIQKRLYFMQQLDLESTAYNMPTLVVLEERIEKEKLEAILNKLILRHEILRTSFELVNDTPVQKIHDVVNFAVDYFDVDEEEAREVVKTYIKPFDLYKPPLFSVGFIKVEAGHNVMIFNMHHLITDAVSEDILKREFMSILSGKVLTPLSLQYKDFSEWQNSQWQQKEIQKQEEYWLKIFEDEPPVLNLPTDYPRPEIQSFEGRIVSFTLTDEQSQLLKKMSRDLDATIYMCLLAVFNVFLSVLSGQEDIVVGTPIAGRRHADLQNVLGLFLNTLAVRNYPRSEKTFEAFLLEVKDRILEAYENQEYHFEDLVNKILIKRDPSRNPLFDVVFNQLNHTEYLGRRAGLDGRNGYELKKNTSGFDIVLTAVDLGGQLYFNIEYCSTLFEKKTIERFINYFKEIIDLMIENRHIKLKDISISSALSESISDYRDMEYKAFKF